MHTPATSSLFTPWTDPESGITSYILTERIAPIQESFYFTNPSMSHDGRYLWLYCAFPPSGRAQTGRFLAVVDFEADTLRWFPETAFYDASPAVDHATGTIYWCTNDAVWRRGPGENDPAQQVNTFPVALSKDRLTHRLATHLTFSADGKELFIDAQIGADFFVGSLPVDGSDFQLWQQFNRCFNHAQFSPTDPDLALIAEDYWVDPVTGERYRYENRMWLIRRGEKAQPILPGPSLVGHEWWDADGEHVWVVDYQAGTVKVNIHSKAVQMIWPSGRWHSHCDATGSYLVGDNHSRDETGKETARRVSWYDIATDTEKAIVSKMPVLAIGSTYHDHPHPQFVAQDQYVAYTTSVLDRLDVAIVPVDSLR